MKLPELNWRKLFIEIVAYITVAVTFLVIGMSVLKEVT